MKNYDKFYEEGGFGYSEHLEEWIFDNVFEGKYEKDASLLDAGCGDGFWSFLLSSRFNVTGIDTSHSGIKMALKKSRKYKTKNIDFICGDALEVRGCFDIIFCRAISCLNLPPQNLLFKENMQKLFSLCKKELIYIQYTQKPYGRWDESNLFDKDSDSKTYYNSKWYYHDPEELYKVFSQLGNAEVRDIDSYIVGKIKKI